MSFQLQNPIKYVFHHVEIIVDDHSPPVTNTWYTVLTATGGIEVESVTIIQTNTEAAAKDVDIEIIADGVTLTKSTNLVDSTENFLYTDTDGNIQYRDTNFAHAGLKTVSSTGMEIMERVFKANNFRLRVKNVSAAGTAQTLTTSVNHKLLKAV